MPGLPSGRVDLVVPDRQPRVLVGRPARAADPRTGLDRRLVAGRLVHRRIVARDGRGRRRVGAGRLDSADDARPSDPPASPASSPPSTGTSASRRATASSCRRTSGGRPATPPDAVPAILEMIPYGKDNWRRNADTASRRVVRGARLRAVPGRRPRDRVVGRRRARRVHRGRDARRLRRRRVARRPAVVHRRGRDVGHLVRRLHGDPGREAAAAAPAGDRPGPGHRRPLPDRRPLHRRLRDRERAVAVRGQPGRDERDAAGRVVPRRRRGSTSGARGSRRRRRGWSSGCASRPTARTGGRARWHPTTTRSRRRSSASAAGATRTSTRRSGCRRAARRRRGRSSATGSTAGRRTRRPGRTSTSSTRSCGSSTAGCATRPTGSTTSPPSSGSSATTRSRSRSRTRGPGGGGRPTRIRIRRPMVRPFLFEGGGDAARRPPRGARPGGAPASTPIGTDRRSARAAACPGAPAASRTGSPATSGRTRASGRRSRALPWSSRSRSSASRSRSCISRSTRRSRPPSSAWRTSRRTGRRHG